MTNRPEHIGSVTTARAQRAVGFDGPVRGRVSRRTRRAFTLIEMVVVISIILVILGMALPAASSLWNDRKSSEAINTIQGLLMNARVKALDSDGVETGFFAIVDEQGLQRFIPLRQNRKMLGQPAWEDVFEVTDEPDQTLLAPMRVVPRYVVNNPLSPDFAPVDAFNDDELANDNVLTAVGDQAQRHRNFFTMIFSTDGNLIVGRDVLIKDNDEDADGFGDRTQLPVGPGKPASPIVNEFYDVSRNSRAEIRGAGGKTPIDFLVREDTSSTVALNFPSVDGLLVYDDAVFRSADLVGKREVLLRTGQPLYLSRWTGVVIRGPKDETQ